MAAKRTFVIVGAGFAGAKAAETLREEGFDGEVVLLGAEADRPYERPPLSKDYLRGETERSKVYVHDEGFYSEHDIDLRTNTPAAAIDVSESAVVLESGERIGYEALLLATGSASRRIPIPGAELDGIHYLRELPESDALREILKPSMHIAVVGAGWIGSEVAASARPEPSIFSTPSPSSISTPWSRWTSA
jgi:3-phenylpropionate/trans-cinnamate dioxygenase ferredoxin reductase subunit